VKKIIVPYWLRTFDLNDIIYNHPLLKWFRLKQASHASLYKNITFYKVTGIADGDNGNKIYTLEPLQG
jgi:hypothetical protein